MYHNTRTSHTLTADLQWRDRWLRMSRNLFLLLFIFTLTDPVYNDKSFRFKHPINNIAVGRQNVIVATENCLYLFNHTLHMLKTTGPFGENEKICMEDNYHKPTTYYNKILLVYNDNVLTCWNKEKGSCRELRIDNLKTVGNAAECVVPLDPQHPVRGLIFFKESSIYLLVAKFQNNDGCDTTKNTIVLRERDTDSFTIKQVDLSVSLKVDTPGLNYVDPFQWNGTFFFPYYPSVGNSAKVLVVKTNDNNLDLHALSNLTCGNKPERKIILSSFAFHSLEGLFWAGIFTTNDTAFADRTALCIYNFTVLKERASCITEDFDVTNVNYETYAALLPLHGTPTVTHGDLTAVHVQEVERRLVFFLGTGNGKLLKVALNSNYTANCPEVFYTFTEEAAIFQTMYMDPVDTNYLYVATAKEIKRLKIANCEQYESCNDCLSAYDPHCGWCHSEKRCSMKTECEASTLQAKWTGISEGYGKCLKVKVFRENEKISVQIEKNPSLFDENAPWNCEIIHKGKTLCSSKNEILSSNCSCRFTEQKMYETDAFTAAAKCNGTTISAKFHFQKCSQYLENSCLDCISSGCLWCTNTSTCISPLSQCEGKDYADEEKCKAIEERAARGPSSNVTIEFVAVDRVTSVGKKNVLIKGNNLQDLTRVFLFGASSCKPQVLVVSHYENNTALISLPQSQNEVKRLCVNFDGNCYNKSISYESVSCSAIAPNTVWLSGGRNISISGKNLLDFVDYITISRDMYKELDIMISKCLGNSSHCNVIVPQLGKTVQTFTVSLTIQESVVTCGKLMYKADPTFKSYQLLNENGAEIELRIEKTKDELEIQPHEIEVQIHYEKEVLNCTVWNITVFTQDYIYCKARKALKEKVYGQPKWIEVILGNLKVEVQKLNSEPYLFILLIVPLLVIVVIATILITRHKSKQLSSKLEKDLEELECEIRKEIREGFAELQTDKEDVTEDALGTIPFFDYKHFALNSFFPESEKNKQDFCEKLCENIPSPFQTRKSTQDEEIISTMKTLFENQNFLVLVIHTLEKQRDFSVKDRCMFASFLTITFQSNLLYLTGLLERLTKDLIEQSNNKHPKLMLRRTETVVEKLLTNWMSTCLYGFLREYVGEPLYNLVYTLNQRIHKGPIDAVTSKALYTLNEDWLLWQITEFSIVEINVHFPKTSEQEDENIEQCLKVTVLDCDTIEQVKEKILQSFQMKKGYSFGHPLCDIVLESHHGQTFKELADVDSSNVVTEHTIRKLNTIKHYQIDNGATINVVIKKNGGSADMEYSKEQYCHLEIPESEGNEPQNPENKGKHRFKVKELYLTKLLSTKVAVHSSVEKLFKSIWTVPHKKPPVAIKYFFDLLDTQAEIRKITDPDVVHIWKTNSLPLRFWINILKNPQFVLVIKKTALLEICLSVIAQAFMDGFSLAEHQLGKSAPTNKLLYAKDIPLFKEEVKAYYKNIRDAPPLSSTELTDFLTSESKKHVHEFKDDVAVKELFKYIEKYFNVIISTLEKETGFDTELRQLSQLKKILEDKNKCVWE